MQNGDGTKSVLTTGQVAALCHVAPRTVAKWVDSGFLGYVLPGSKDRRIPKSQLIDFLKMHRMPLGRLDDSEGRILLVGPAAEKVKNHIDMGKVTRTAADSFEAGVQSTSVIFDCAVVDFGIGVSEAMYLSSRMQKQSPGIILIGLLDDYTAPPEHFDECFYTPFEVLSVAHRVCRLVNEKRLKEKSND